MVKVEQCCKYVIVTAREEREQPTGSAETEERVSTDFSNIGFVVNSSKDVYDMIVNNTDKMEIFACGDIQYAILKLDEHSWLYYYGDEDGIDGEHCELVFLNPYFKNVRFTDWVDMPEGHIEGMIQIFCDGEDADFPLNVVVPNAFVYHDEEMNERLTLSMTMFAQDLDVYESFEECRKAKGGGMCLNGCIPCGTFPIPGKEDKFVPSATALMSGTVIGAEKLVNSYTGNDFWFITFDCCGHTFAAVADPEFAPEGIKKGDFVDGYFWISGLIMSGIPNEGEKQ